MGSRRVSKTRSLSSYLNSINQTATSTSFRVNARNTIATNSIAEDSIAEELQLFDKSIQSGDYVPGYSGWKISGMGDAEFGNVVVRGDINATTGTIGYWNISNPTVSRVIGTTTLFGTFLESSATGSSDEGITSGTYVGLFKSAETEELPVTYKERVSNVATLTVDNHDFIVGDLLYITLEDDTTFNNNGDVVTVTEVTLNTFSYSNDGLDVSLSETAGYAQLYVEDVAGLYLRDYSKTEFDYGYFSSKGLAYVSAADINAIRNPSFEYANTVVGSTGFVGDWPLGTSYYLGSYNQSTSFSSASWVSSSFTNASLTSYDFGSAGLRYSSNSRYGALVKWSNVAPTSSEYFVASVDFDAADEFSIFTNGKLLNFNFDVYFYQTRLPISVTSFNATAANVTFQASASHNLAIGSIVFLDFDATDAGGRNYSKTSVLPISGNTTNYGYAHTVTAVPTSTSFTIANQTGVASSAPMVLTTTQESKVIESLTPSGAYIDINLGGTSQNNIYRASDSVTLSIDVDTRYSGLKTVVSTELETIRFSNPLYKSVTNKVLTTNVVTITTSTAHGYVAGDTVFLQDVDKAINISNVNVTSNVVTLTVASSTGLVVGETVKISGLTQLGVDYDNLTWTTTTGTTGTTVKFSALEHITAGLGNVATTAVSGPTATPNIFDGSHTVASAPTTTTFTYAYIRANYTTTAVTSAYSWISDVLSDPLIFNVGSIVMANTNAYEAFSPVFDLTDMVIQYGSNASATSSIYDVLSLVDSSLWSSKRQRSLSANAHMLYQLGYLDSGVSRIPELSAISNLNISIDGAKVWSKYKELNPTGIDASEDILIKFPASLHAGTVAGTYSVDGSGSVTDATLVRAVSTEPVGYILDNVMLSTDSSYFDASVGGQEYFWYSNLNDGPSHASIQLPKHWLLIDLNTQASRAELDYYGINDKTYSKKLFKPAYIGSVDVNNIASEFFSVKYLETRDLATVTVSSGEVEHIVSTQHTYLKSALTNYVGTDTTGFELLGTTKNISTTDGEVEYTSLVGIEGHLYASDPSNINSEMHLYSDQILIQSSSPSSMFNYIIDSTGIDMDTGTILLPAVNVELTTGDRVAPLQIGDIDGVHTIFGDREIQTRGTASTASSFYVNFYGGSVVIGNTTVGLGKIDSTSDYVWANGVYGNTLSTSYRSVYVSSTGTYDELGYVASSRRFKKNIEPLSYTAEQILSVAPVQYHYNEEEDSKPKHAGMIAEEMHDAGLHAFISYDKEGLPETIQYEFYVTALQQVVRHQAEQIANLTSRIEALENK